MKCIWRILLGVLTAGLSEVLRHKNHDKSLPCPDPVTVYVALGSLVVDDFFVYDGLVYQVLDVATAVRVKHVPTGDNFFLSPDLRVFKLN